jgi:hypothetical protein
MRGIEQHGGFALRAFRCFRDPRSRFRGPVADARARQVGAAEQPAAGFDPCEHVAAFSDGTGDRVRQGEAARTRRWVLGHVALADRASAVEDDALFGFGVRVGVPTSPATKADKEWCAVPAASGDPSAASV